MGIILKIEILHSEFLILNLTEENSVYGQSLFHIILPRNILNIFFNQRG